MYINFNVETILYKNNKKILSFKKKKTQKAHSIILFYHFQHINSSFFIHFFNRHKSKYKINIFDLPL
jgi:hypothetical protein